MKRLFFLICSVALVAFTTFTGCEPKSPQPAAPGWQKKGPVAQSPLGQYPLRLEMVLTLPERPCDILLRQKETGSAYGIAYEPEANQLQLFRRIQKKKALLGPSFSLEQQGLKPGDTLRLYWDLDVVDMAVSLQKKMEQGWGEIQYLPPFQDRQLDRESAPWEAWIQARKPVDGTFHRFAPRNPAPAIDWTIEKGWLTAREGNAEYLKVGGEDQFPINMEVAGKWLMEQNPQTTVLEKDGGWDIQHKTEEGRMVDRIRPFPAFSANAWLRTATYTNTSVTTQDLTFTKSMWEVNREKLGETWKPVHFVMAEVGEDRVFCAAVLDPTDENFPNLFDDYGEVAFDSKWRLAPGQTATVGTQAMWISPGKKGDFRPLIQRWYASADIREDKAVPDWLKGGILYSASANGHVDSRFSDVAGFRNYMKQLDYLRDLGVDIIWHKIPFYHKTPPNPVEGGWNHYEPLDYTKIDPILGGETDFARLIQACQDKGMRTLCEVVPWGGGAIQKKELPQWWCRQQDGSLNIPYGAMAIIDYASPPWQEVLFNALRIYNRYGIGGVRIDVTDGMGPNWASPRTNHATFMGIPTAREHLALYRDALMPGLDHLPIMLPESFRNRPMYYAIPDCLTVGIGHDTTQRFATLGDIRDGASMAEQLTDFFEHHRAALPAGSLIRRTLNNINTLVEHGRTTYRFGGGLSRALYGICLMVPGVPQLVQEEEIGHYDALRRMHRARKSIPEFHQGRARYRGIDKDERVFAVLREWNGRYALGLVNLSGDSVEQEIQLPADVTSWVGRQAWDGVSGRQAAIDGGRLNWNMEAYEVALIRLGRHPRETSLPETWAGEKTKIPVVSKSGPQPLAQGVRLQQGNLALWIKGGVQGWTVEEQGPEKILLKTKGGRLLLEKEGETWKGEMELEAGQARVKPPLFAIYNADRWAVSGQTALLEDRLLRRHFPFPEEADYYWDRYMTWGTVQGGKYYNHVFPCGRLWQSLLEPLHPKKPALGFADRMGNGILVEVTQNNAENIVLTDRTDEDDSEPYGLELRFYSRDPDLAAGVHQFGFGQLWQMEEAPEADNETARLHFRLSFPEKSLAEAMKAERLPLARGGAVESRTGQSHDYVDINEGILSWPPNTVSWENLQGAPGKYRIALNLRHGENPEEDPFVEMYKVRLNGKLLAPLEWRERAIWSSSGLTYGLVFTPEVELSGGPHTLSIEMTGPGGAFRKHITLVQE